MAWTDEPVKYRQLLMAAGYALDVPEHIVRVDDAPPGRWQLRYGEWTDYVDSTDDRSGVEASLQKAVAEMRSRIEYRGK